MNILNISAQELRKAADLQEKIQSLQSELNSILGGLEPGAASTPGKRNISAAGRARIAAASKARWAKFRKQKGAAPTKPTRKMSAAGKARLSALAKARWAKVKKAGKSKL